MQTPQHSPGCDIWRWFGLTSCTAQSSFGNDRFPAIPLYMGVCVCVRQRCGKQTSCVRVLVVKLGVSWRLICDQSDAWILLNYVILYGNLFQNFVRIRDTTSGFTYYMQHAYIYSNLVSNTTVSGNRILPWHSIWFLGNQFWNNPPLDHFADRWLNYISSTTWCKLSSTPPRLSSRYQVIFQT